MKTTAIAFILGLILSAATASAKETRDCSFKSAKSLWAKTNPNESEKTATKVKPVRTSSGKTQSAQ